SRAEGTSPQTNIRRSRSCHGNGVSSSWRPSPAFSHFSIKPDLLSVVTYTPSAHIPFPNPPQSTPAPGFFVSLSSHFQQPANAPPFRAGHARIRNPSGRPRVHPVLRMHGSHTQHRTIPAGRTQSGTRGHPCTRPAPG